jgi:KUP system potassium uptake protein
LTLALGALGVVYGDIGTSPLYAVRECFHGFHAVTPQRENIFGVLSLIFWSLIMVVTVKYVIFIMQAENRGEGGIFALLGLLRKARERLSDRVYQSAVLAALFGAALLYGDGIITPSISVLSAVEGLEMATHASRPLVLPLTVLILFLLFTLQKRGTEIIGKYFGPVMLVWFITIAFLGARALMAAPSVLKALYPGYAVQFFLKNGLQGFLVLGSVVLCITGGEALYADMGHFNPRAIRFTWLTLVLPALLINYFGQGALLLTQSSAAVNPFYGLAPRGLIYPLVILSTLATIIASQAMISGIYSLTQQAVQLGYLPRFRIVHTSARKAGQIYLPEINWAMMIACIGLVLAFKQSARLAGAYGIAVTATMAITSIVYYLVVTRLWQWKPWKALLLAGTFLLFDLAFVGANLLKFLDGGWFTVGVALVLTVSMTTWHKGRRLLADLFAMRLSMELFIKDVAEKNPPRIPGTAVFMSLNPKGVPVALMHHFKHHRILFEKVILLSIVTEDIPRLSPKERIGVKDLGQGFYRVIARYGFMETPSVPEILALLGRQGIPTRLEETTFFLGRETLLTSGKSPMARWRKILFSWMTRNAMNPTVFFGIPPGRVIEIGAQVEL